MHLNNKIQIPKKGALIVFEGIDRSGKTSQARLLYDRFAKDNTKVKLLTFPDRSTSTGKLISTVLSGVYTPPPKAVHLLFAANRWEVYPHLFDYLSNGFLVIIDRYSFSGVAYSTTAANILAARAAAAAATGAASEAAAAATATIETAAATGATAATAAAAAAAVTEAFAKGTEEGLPAPDLVIYLDINPRETVSRDGYGGELYESIDLQERVQAAFSSFSHLPYWTIINAGGGRSPADIHQQIYGKVIELLASMNEAERSNMHLPRPTLWG